VTLQGINGNPADYNGVGEMGFQKSDYTARLVRDY
jgi:hypothetical protein